MGGRNNAIIGVLPTAHAQMPPLLTYVPRLQTQSMIPYSLALLIAGGFVTEAASAVAVIRKRVERVRALELLMHAALETQWGLVMAGPLVLEALHSPREAALRRASELVRLTDVYPSTSVGCSE